MPALHALAVDAVTLDTPDGPALSATWSWPGALFGQQDVERLAGLWFTALQGLVAHIGRGGAGGHTPSDLTWRAGPGPGPGPGGPGSSG